MSLYLDSLELSSVLWMLLSVMVALTSVLLR